MLPLRVRYLILKPLWLAKNSPTPLLRSSSARTPAAQTMPNSIGSVRFLTSNFHADVCCILMTSSPHLTNRHVHSKLA